MKFRTDFVTNSSSSSFICEKIATFTLTDKSGASSDITFKKNNSTFGCDVGDFTEGKVYVPELFNDFLYAYYRETQKIPSAGVVLNSLLAGKETPLVKSFIKYTGMESISEATQYFRIEKATVSSSMGSRLDNEWKIYLNHLNIDYSPIGDYAEFIKVREAHLKYNFIVFHFEEWFGDYSSRFHDGYDKEAEFVFGETKQHFAEFNDCGRYQDNWETLKDEIIAESTKKYLQIISSGCNLPEAVLEKIENGEIKILFYANDTGICDEIIWYSGELTKENINIHLFSEGENVTDISDNTDEVNTFFKNIINTSNKTVKPVDRKKIAEIVDSEENSNREAYGKPVNNPLSDEIGCKSICLTKEEAKGIWTTKKDALGHTHIVAYKGNGESTLYIPSEIGGEKINLIGLSCAYDMISKNRKREIKEVIIGDGIKYIGRYAFAEMNSLHSIIIPSSVTYISPLAFYGTDSIEVDSIEDYSYGDSLVDYIGEYTGQFPLEGKSVCFIESAYDYRWRTTEYIRDEVKELLTSSGAIFQSKPNTKTSLVIIEDDFCCISDKLDIVFEIIKKGKSKAKAITCQKFLDIFGKNR